MVVVAAAALDCIRRVVDVVATISVLAYSLLVEILAIKNLVRLVLNLLYRKLVFSVGKLALRTVLALPRSLKTLAQFGLVFLFYYGLLRRVSSFLALSIRLE